jgi:apolipoprotein N-acyltransferase
MDVAVSIISGILLALAFPKFDLWWLAWVALVPLFWALRKTENWKQSLVCGFAFGLVFFGIHLFWVNTLTRFVGWWAVLAWGCLVIFQSLFILLFCLFTKPLDKSSGYYPLFTALLWTAIEWLRAWGPFGVTGGDIGYSQAQFLPLIQIASFASVYGVSFMVVLVNAALADVGTALVAVREKRTGINPVPTLCTLVLAGLLVGGACVYGELEIRHSKFDIRHFPRIALIQPNIDQMDKMNPRLVIPIYEIQEKMTRQAATLEPEIIIWPETAVLSYIERDPRLLSRLRQLAKEVDAWLVIGTPHYDDSGKIYNSIISISPSGEIVSRYDKERLVPFGEYLPFRPLLYPFLKYTRYYEEDFGGNPDPQPVMAAGYKIAAAVCFESTFPDLIRRRAAKGCDFILTITNDAWFGDSSAPYYHLNNAVFRAIENRRYFVQVGNTGLSAVIDPYGRILKKSRLKEKGVTGLLTATPIFK